MKQLVVLILTLSVSSMAMAARVDRRENRQQGRIHNGVKSGELTQGEAAKLRHDQRRIERTENRMRADGNLSPAEKAKLERMQDKESARIYKLKHNDRQRTAGDNNTFVPPAGGTDAAAPAESGVNPPPAQ